MLKNCSYILFSLNEITKYDILTTTTTTSNISSSNNNVL